MRCPTTTKSCSTIKRLRALVEKIAGQPLLFEPGSKFLHEEHSAYNLLALIVEKKTGMPFASAVEKLVFRPAGLTASGVDDDATAHAERMAKGYEPEGTYALKPATEIHWSAKTGNASVYTTAANEARWVATLFQGHALSPASREAVLDTSQKVGYGWMRGENKRFGETVYYMNGRAPGFASFVLYLPRAQMTVVLLSNIYSSATTTIGYDVAALSIGLPYEPSAFSGSSAHFRGTEDMRGQVSVWRGLLPVKCSDDSACKGSRTLDAMARRKHFATHPGFGRSFRGSIVLGGRQD